MPLPSNLKYFSCYKSHSNKTNRALSDSPEVVDEVSHCVNVQLLFVIRTLSHSVISLSGENKIFHEHKKSSLGHLTLWGWRARHQCWDRENRLRHGQESCSHRGNRSFHGQESCCLRPTQGTRQRHACTWGYVIAEKYLRGDIFKYCLCFLLSSDICEWMCFDSNRHYLLIFWFSETKKKYFFCFSTSRLGLAPLPREQSRRREKIVHAALPRSTYSLAFKACALKFDW